MTHVADVCGCIPEYVPNVREVINKPAIKGCNFYEHATCVSYVMYYFDPVVSPCLPACINSIYYRARIEYIGEPQAVTKDDVKFVTTEMKLSSVGHVVYKETPVVRAI